MQPRALRVNQASRATQNGSPCQARISRSGRRQYQPERSKPPARRSSTSRSAAPLTSAGGPVAWPFGGSGSSMPAWRAARSCCQHSCRHSGSARRNSSGATWASKAVTASRRQPAKPGSAPSVCSHRRWPASMISNVFQVHSLAVCSALASGSAPWPLPPASPGDVVPRRLSASVASVCALLIRKPLESSKPLVLTEIARISLAS